MSERDDDPRDGFIPLWPTVLVQRRLAEHGEQAEALIKIVRAMERDNPNLTTEYTGADFFNREDPPIRWLKARIDETLIEYFKWAGMNYSIDWIVQGWPNINRFGDYHDTHNHPRSYLSGTYYLKIPKLQEKLQSRGDLRPGCITFYDPRGATNMNAIRDDPYVDPEHTVRPVPGLLMMWPAFVNHFVHPNLSKETRITISFNILLKWSDDYLPRQP